VIVAERIAAFKAKGFTDEQSEVIALMQIAAGVLFRAFPESFLLFGGATLLLFHQSVRHSADLDLLSRTDKLPSAEELGAVLAEGVASTAEALNVGPLQFENASTGHLDTKLWVKSADGKELFRIDLNRFGSVIEGQVEEAEIRLEDDTIARVKKASPDFLLLQKAECFLLRRIVKARDAFDIDLLTSRGATLDTNLKAHLADTLMAYEIEPGDIINRIEKIDEKRCRYELQPVLPAEAFDALAKRGFKPLRDRLHELYADWL
jgi:Nucleotidyl transferase AbiEii toxin, Type IV TA system